MRITRFIEEICALLIDHQWLIENELTAVWVEEKKSSVFSWFIVRCFRIDCQQISITKSCDALKQRKRDVRSKNNFSSLIIFSYFSCGVKNRTNRKVVWSNDVRKFEWDDRLLPLCKLILVRRWQSDFVGYSSQRLVDEISFSKKKIEHIEIIIDFLLHDTDTLDFSHLYKKHSRFCIQVVLLLKNGPCARSFRSI